MKRLLPVLGALALVAGGAAYVVFQEPEVVSAPTRDMPPNEVLLQYTDGSKLWHSSEPQTLLVKQVLAELDVATMPKLDELRRTGAVVTTTIDPKAQAAAVSVLEQASSAGQKDLRYSLTAINPANGAVEAYVPGVDNGTVDYATGVLKEPGAAFLPITVVAALETGKTTMDDAMRDALAKSNPTAIRDRAFDAAGIQGVTTTAHQAGVPKVVTVNGNRQELLVGAGGGPVSEMTAVGAGDARMRPLDLTAVYATFAANGVRNSPHFIRKITGPENALLYMFHDGGKPALAKDVVAQVSSVLRDSSACQGAVCRSAGFEVDGASGKYHHVWTVGYTSQLAVTVFAGYELTGPPITGTGVTQQIWQQFLAKARS